MPETELYKLFDYVNERGENEFEFWCQGLQTGDLAKLNRKLDMLRKEPSLPPQLLAGPLGGTHVYKLKVNGRVALRPMLCKGPIENDHEFTLLYGAVERDRVLVPEDAVSRAADRRERVIADPARRRRPHERVTRGT
jgi:hypothetical protein